MKKKILSALLCLGMTVSLVAGCSGGGGNTGSKTGTSGTSKTASASNGTKEEVVIWDYFETDAQKKMMEDMISGFNSSQDKYTASHVYVPFADYEKQLTLGMASGELPDLVILDGCGMASFIEMDLFGDVSNANIKWDEYMEGPMASTMADGKHYGIPFATNCTALFYNKDIFDKAGIKYPDENTTWEDFRKMAKDLTKDGVVGFGNAATGTDEGTFQCLQWLYTAGGDYQNIGGGKDAILGTAIINTLIFTVASIFFQFFIRFGLALLFSKKFKGSSFFRGVTMISWLLPVTVAGLLFKFMFASKGGIINQLFMSLHLIDAPLEWLLDPKLAMVAIVTANIWIGIPFNMMLLITGLTTIPEEVYESSKLDGATKFQTLVRITIPMIKPAIMSVLTLGFVYTFKVFDLVWVMTKGGSVNATELASTYAYKLSFEQFQFSKGAAASEVLRTVLL